MSGAFRVDLGETFRRRGGRERERQSSKEEREVVELVDVFVDIDGVRRMLSAFDAPGVIPPRAYNLVVVDSLVATAGVASSHHDASRSPKERHWCGCQTSSGNGLRARQAAGIRTRQVSVSRPSIFQRAWGGSRRACDSLPWIYVLRV